MSNEVRGNLLSDVSGLMTIAVASIYLLIVIGIRQ